MVIGLAAALAGTARAQQVVDRIVARVGDDIITLSDIQELGRYQQLVQGKEQPQAERLRELIEQWVVQRDATLSGFRAPAKADVDKAFAELEKRFGSPKAFEARLKDLGLKESDARRMVERQLFLSRYLDFRFRAEVQVTESEIEGYYRNTLVPELKREGQPAPPLESVADRIREVLIERGISQRAEKWMDELRARWNVQMIGGAAEK
jgi:parvulin-like peptidyl-prolyl isomerase